MRDKHLRLKIQKATNPIRLPIRTDIRSHKFENLLFNKFEQSATLNKYPSSNRQNISDTNLTILIINCTNQIRNNILSLVSKRISKILHAILNNKLNYCTSREEYINIFHASNRNKIIYCTRQRRE